MKFTKLFLLFCLLLASAFLPLGCVNSYNVSKRKPFCDYVGLSVELKRPALIVGTGSIWTGDKGVPSVFGARYGLIDSSATNMGYGPVFGELPVGHRVTIISVREEAWGDAGQITAYGYTVIPPSNDQVSFVFPWGIAVSALRHAPWEPDVAK